MTSPVFIAVAPNGARRTKTDHPALPVTAMELAAQAPAWAAAGATLLHLHVRDGVQRHTLAVERYQDALAAVRATVNDNMVLQITTEAVGIYAPSQQMEIVRALRPESASVAVREIASGGMTESALADFYAWAKANGVVIQHVVHSPADLAQLQQWIDRGIVPGQRHALIMALGSYAMTTENPQRILRAYIDTMAQTVSDFLWFVCAFGQEELATILQAPQHGGHIRVGFENNIHLPDGRLAADNTAMLVNLANELRAANRRMGSVQELRSELHSILKS